MRLREWMNKENHTAQTLSEELGASKRNVEKWSRGERLPRSEMAFKIIQLTNGEVSGNDLIAQQVQRNKMSVQGNQV